MAFNASSQLNHLNFDGDNDFVQVAHNADLNFTEDFTLELKFIRERIDIREDLIDKKELIGASPSSNDVAIFITTSGQLSFFLREDLSNTVQLLSTSVIGLGEWTHVGCVREGNNVRLLVNGVLESSGYFDGNITSSGPLRIGSNRFETIDAYATPTYNFDGGIDECRIWNYARTESQINVNKNEELLGDESGLIRYYDFNQGVPCDENFGETIAFDAVADWNGILTNFDLSGTLGDPCSSNWVGRINEQNSINKNFIKLLSCFPNPTTDKIVLTFDRRVAFEGLKLYDMTGQLVFVQSLDKKSDTIELDVNLLANGLYSIVGITDGYAFYLTRFLKE